MEVEVIQVSREAKVSSQKKKSGRGGEENPLRPRNTWPGNKFRLKERAPVKPNLLNPMVINDEDEDKLPLTSLLGVIKKRKLKHGSGNILVELVLKKKKHKDKTMSIAKKLKDSIIPPIAKTPAQGEDGDALKEPMEDLSHDRVLLAKGPVKKKVVKPTLEENRREDTLSVVRKPKDSALHTTTETFVERDDRSALEEPIEGLGHDRIPPVKVPVKKKTRKEALSTAKKLRGFVPLTMTEPSTRKVDEDDVMGPVEVPGCDPDPPAESPVRIKLTKSGIKDPCAKRMMEMQEERCYDKPPEVGASLDNLLVLVATAQATERVVHTRAKRWL